MNQPANQSEIEPEIESEIESDIQPATQSETESPEALFKQGIDRYYAGESPEVLIPLFKDICDRAPKNGASWTCLAWLYLVADKPVKGYKAAQKAVKLNAQDPQARVNLAIAMLEGKHKGVRSHIEVAEQVMLAADELRQEVKKNLEEGLSRRPDWASLKKVNDWLFDS